VNNVAIITMFEWTGNWALWDYDLVTHSKTLIGTYPTKKAAKLAADSYNFGYRDWLSEIETHESL